MTREDKSTLGFVLILFAVCSGLLVVLSPMLVKVHPRIPGHHTNDAIHNLKIADEMFRLDYWNLHELERHPIYKTNWVAELTAAKGSVLNTRKTIFLNARLIDGQPVDEWNQPIRAVSTTNEQGHLGLDFYSVGADGISSSEGNDLDDVNSWNHGRPWSDYYWAKLSKSQSVRITTGLLLWLTILGLGICFRFQGRARSLSDFFEVRLNTS